MTIVLVEDDDLTLAWMYAEFKRTFKGVDIQVFQTESDFMAAIETFVGEPPELIILDIMLRWGNLGDRSPNGPEQTVYRAGLRCFQALSNIESTRCIPTILYTAVDSELISSETAGRGDHVVIISKEQSPEYVITVARGLVAANLKPTKRTPRPLKTGYSGTVFAILPFSEDLNDAYAAMRRAVGKSGKGLTLLRGGTASGAYCITDEIETLIQQAFLIVCDLSAERPNVYYELGYARAQGKLVVCVAKEGTRLHFDIAHLRTLFYRDYTDLETLLRREVVAAVSTRGGHV